MPEASDKPRPRIRPISRWGVGTVSALQIICFAVIVIALNYLAGVRYQRIDLTRTQKYTLSNVTRRLIQSTELQHRTEPVRITIAFKRSSPYYSRVRALAEEYARLSNGKITLKLVDPVRTADLALQLASQYRIDHFTRNLVIVDAREGTKAKTKDAEADEKQKSRDLSARVRFIDESAMILEETDANRQRRPAAFQGEDMLTAALLSALEGTPRKVYLLADKSNVDSGKKTSPWQVLHRTLLLRNIEVVPIRISEIERIPDDARAVALIAPTYDLEKRDIDVIDEYWARARRAFFIALNPAARPPRLRSFLRSHGVTPRDDRVITRAGGQTTTFVRAHFTSGMEFLRDLWEKSTVIEGRTCSLEVREGAPDLLSMRISPYKLIESSENFWGESDYEKPNPAFDPREDHKGPVALAAAVLQGAADETSRMIIIGNSQFLDPDGLRPEMIDFLHSSMNWLIGREHLAGIGPRSLVKYKLPLLQPQIAFVNRTNLVFLPALALLISLFVRHSRRS
jgi:hypothetical protein